MNKPREMWRLLLETILAQYRIKPLLEMRSVRPAIGRDKKKKKNTHKISFNYARDHPVLKWVITSGNGKNMYEMIVVNQSVFRSVLHTQITLIQQDKLSKIIHTRTS